MTARQKVGLVVIGAYMAVTSGVAEAQKKVSAYLVEKYSGDFTATFPQDVGANVAKAYQVIAFAR